MSWSGAPILIARMPPLNPHFYDVVLRWIRCEHRGLEPLFDVCGLPYSLPNDAEYKLHVPWLPDPLERVNVAGFDAANALIEQCDARSVAVINRVERQQNLSKINFSGTLAAAGIRTPRVVAASPVDVGARPMEFPFVLRENRWHQGDFILVTSPEVSESLTLEQFDEPVFSEYFDVRSQDGLYRKFRSIVIGDRVIPHHLQIPERWVTHGKARVKNAATREEELEFLNSPDPFESVWFQISQLTGVDYMAIDYGICHDGRPVVWEANQYPMIHYSHFDMVYRNFSVDRTIAVLVKFYLEKAGLPVPQKLTRQAW